MRALRSDCDAEIQASAEALRAVQESVLANPARGTEKRKAAKKMNRTKIEWTDYTWNPVTGCLRGCKYCYARKISARYNRSFEPTFHEDRLQEPLKIKKPSRIFVCSMGELFASWAERAWQEAVIETVRQCPQHIFQFLTKSPENLKNLNPWPRNAWVGATATDQIQFDAAVAGLVEIDAVVKFISFEPLLSEIEVKLEKIDWVIIGAQTNPNRQPQANWVQKIIDEADRHNVPVFLKPNLIWPKVRREFPRKYFKTTHSK